MDMPLEVIWAYCNFSAVGSVVSARLMETQTLSPPAPVGWGEEEGSTKEQCCLTALLSWKEQPLQPLP